VQREKSKEPNQIAGAFGSIGAHDDERRRGLRARFLTLIAIIGPGLIVMVGDNDAGGVSTYAQAGQNFGYTLLWTLPLLIPVLIIVQEMVARLGAVTGVGHGRLIRERFGQYWGNLSIFSILFLNFLIIVTEFIGISLAMKYFGVSPYISVPVAVVLLFSVTASGSFRRWERFMMLFIAINFIIIPLVIVTHPSFSSMVGHAVVPKIRGGASSSAVLLIISIIGTTVAPWQLFFQESNIVDKRITPRWLNYERVDTIVGSFIVVIVASALVGACAVGLAGHGNTNSYTNALGVARGLGTYVGHDAGALFAIILLNASVIGAAVVTLASSYAIGDLSSSHQGLCGLMLPSTTIIVLMLANDRELMGPWKNGRILNVVAVFMVVVLVILSLTLMISTLFTGIDVLRLLEVLAVIGALGLLVGLPMAWRRWQPPEQYSIDKRDWRTPRLALLSPIPKSPARTILMRSQSCYLFAAGILLAVRIIQLLTS
jgi:NRAMP (natural resistance-associated macrophage protein)-like metal ion transporter